MASPQPAGQPAVASPSIEHPVDGINALKVDESSAATAETQQDGQVEKPQEGESQLARLHRLCAEGDVMGVRAILSQGLDLLESIGEFFSALKISSAIAGRFCATVVRRHGRYQ